MVCVLPWCVLAVLPWCVLAVLAVLAAQVLENTPGGMNEQAIANLSRAGVYTAYDQTQHAVYERLSGQGDGHRYLPTHA